MTHSTDLTQTSLPVARPNPLVKAAAAVGSGSSAVVAVVSAMLTFGVLSSVQADAVYAATDAAPGLVTGLGTLIAGVMPLVAGLISAFGTAAVAKQDVTPVGDPRNVDGVKLVPAALPVVSPVREDGTPPTTPPLT